MLVDAPSSAPPLARRAGEPSEPRRVSESSSTGQVDRDVDLGARVARGDAAAQRAFVVRLIGSVRRTVRALLSTTTDADDAVQLSMIELLRSAGTYRGDATLERWAGRIAARTTLHLARKQRARGELSLTDTDDSELGVALSTEPGEVLSVGIQAHLRSLSEGRRTCLLLRYVHGYTVDEVAELTSVSPNTVKDRLLQGRAELRKAMRRDHDGDEERGRSPTRRRRP